MKSFLSLRTLVAAASLLLFSLALASQSNAQTDDGFGDSGADPVKLFERGQSAHARGDLQKALEFYEQALKVRPEFPEAEFQKGVVLVSLSRLPEAEAALKRAIALKKNWSLPYSALGALFVKQSRDAEAESMFRQALTLDAQDAIALRLLADLKLRSGAAKEALELARKATSAKDAPSSSWVVLAMAERANGSRDVARKILDQILDNEPDNLAALIERADLSTEEKAYDAAIKDLQTADKSKPGDKSILGRLAYVYQQAGRVSPRHERTGRDRGPPDLAVRHDTETAHRDALDLIIGHHRAGGRRDAMNGRRRQHREAAGRDSAHAALPNHREPAHMHAARSAGRERHEPTDAEPGHVATRRHAQSR